MIKMTTIPNERGTGVFTLEFLSETDQVIVPVTAAWQLMWTDGTVVNNRSFANCPFTGTTVAISGDDLQLFDNDDRRRIFAIQATYNSKAGVNLSLNDEVMFRINNLISQT